MHRQLEIAAAPAALQGQSKLMGEEGGLDQLQAVAQEGKKAHPDKWSAQGFTRSFTLLLLSQGLSDLMGENEDGINVMQWLKSAYPDDWKNLLERLQREDTRDPKLGGLNRRCG